MDEQPTDVTTRLTAITDPQDARIAAYRAVRERDLVGREGRFVAEGSVVLRELTRAGRFKLESVLMAENRVTAMTDWIAALPQAVPVYRASRDVMDTIAGFPIHRGLLGIGLRGEEPDAQALLAQMPVDALVICCVGITNHDNIGGIFRNAAAFGAAGILLDGACCDPLYRKALRVSVGAAASMPFARCGDAGELVAHLARHDFTALALTPGGTQTLDEAAQQFRGRRAVILGTEGPGLPRAVLEACEGVSIPMHGGFDSLNVATTSGIALYALTRSS
ncbi:MAG: TrmH family RNA methyltransferase [Salinarimonas sp.]